MNILLLSLVAIIIVISCLGINFYKKYKQEVKDRKFKENMEKFSKSTTKESEDKYYKETIKYL